MRPVEQRRLSRPAEPAARLGSERQCFRVGASAQGPEGVWGERVKIVAWTTKLDAVPEDCRVAWRRERAFQGWGLLLHRRLPGGEDLLEPGPFLIRQARRELRHARFGRREDLSPLPARLFGMRLEDEDALLDRQLSDGGVGQGGGFLTTQPRALGEQAHPPLRALLPVLPDLASEARDFV